MKNISHYRFVILFIIFVFAVTNIQSPFSFRHYESQPILFYFLIAIISCLIYLVPTSKFIFAEKLIYALLVSCIALFCATIVTEIILAPIYGYDPNFDTLQSPVILQNVLFYFFTHLFAIGIFRIWLKNRKEIYT